MRAGNRPLPTVATVPPNRCRPADSAGYPITTAIVVASHDHGRVEALGFRCISPALSIEGTAVTARFDG